MVFCPKNAASADLDRMGYPIREIEESRSIRCDFRAAQEDQSVGPSSSGPNSHGPLAPRPTVQSSQVQVAVSSAPKDHETVVSASLAVLTSVTDKRLANPT